MCSTSTHTTSTHTTVTLAPLPLTLPPLAPPPLAPSPLAPQLLSSPPCAQYPVTPPPLAPPATLTTATHTAAAVATTAVITTPIMLLHDSHTTVFFVTQEIFALRSMLTSEKVNTKKKWCRAPNGQNHAVWAGQVTSFLCTLLLCVQSGPPPSTLMQSVQSCVAHYFHEAPTFIWHKGGANVIHDMHEQVADEPQREELQR